LTTDGIGRRLSKIVKNESKADQASLDVAVKELEVVQKLQKVSIKVTLSLALPHPHAFLFMDSTFFFSFGRSFSRRRLYPTSATLVRWAMRKRRKCNSSLPAQHMNAGKRANERQG
jgi:hypothetical protein